MNILTAFNNRLGNRSNNQDRCLVQELPGRVLLVVADGMGGHPRGDLAAQVTVDSLARSFLSHKGLIDDPVRFLEQAINHAHLAVVDAGRAETPAITPRTTCVACVVQDGHAWWAHLGDSRLYVLREGAVRVRTRDHTPVEELLANGLISERESTRHPMRNSVNRCLGGNVNLPDITFDDAALCADDLLLLCSDGLWSALAEQQLTGIAPDSDLEQTTASLCEDAERASYPHSDNITLVAMRWLGADTAQAPPPPAVEEKPDPPAPAPEPPAHEDPLQQAIEDINRALLDYAEEMKK